MLLGLIDNINAKKKNNQHTDFPGGHPPEYYPRLTLLNFTDRTGCGAVSVIWPITILYVYSLVFESVMFVFIYFFCIVFYNNSNNKMFFSMPFTPLVDTTIGQKRCVSRYSIYSLYIYIYTY